MKNTAHHQPNVKVYMWIFGALLVLTVLTVSVSHMNLPHGVGIPVGIAIAVVKAGLVAAFFMHLKGERGLIYGVLGLTAVFFAILYFLPSIDSRGTAHQRIEEPAAEAEHH